MRAVSLDKEKNIFDHDESIALLQDEICDRYEVWEGEEEEDQLKMRDEMIGAFCPQIFGMFPIKLVVMMALCGGDIADDKTTKRHQVHVLLYGDTAFGKTTLLDYSSKIASKSCFITGAGTTVAGLTVAVVKTDDENEFRAGALVKADGGICCIDDFHALSQAGHDSILEAMEQQTISTAKIGQVRQFKSRCTVLAAATSLNNYGKKNKKTDPTNMDLNAIPIPSPLLSRFDLVLVLREVEGSSEYNEWDSGKIEYILNQATSGFNESDNSQFWNYDRLKMYFIAANKIKITGWTEIATAMIGGYFKKCRLHVQRLQSRTTPRLLESLNRIAESHARLLFRETVTDVDAYIPIVLMESSFGFGINEGIRKYDCITQKLPLGPNRKDIDELLVTLDIDPKFYQTQ